MFQDETQRKENDPDDERRAPYVLAAALFLSATGASVRVASVGFLGGLRVRMSATIPLRLAAVRMIVTISVRARLMFVRIARVFSGHFIPFVKNGVTSYV
jgi:hypothetical protein